MRKKRIIIDMDNTMNYFVREVVKYYNSVLKLNITEDDITDYSFYDCLKYPSVAISAFERPGFFKNLEILPGCQKYFNMLLEDGHDVIVATQLPEEITTSAEDKKDWIQRYFPSFEANNNLIFIKRKYLITGDILFDDSPHHLNSWKQYNKKGKTVKINYAYNVNTASDYSLDLDTAWKSFYAIASK